MRADRRRLLGLRSSASPPPRRTTSASAAVFRFVINPLFLFSGTFFPLTQLPESLLVEWIAAATPLFHGVALVRGAVLRSGTLAAGRCTLAYLRDVRRGIAVWLADRHLSRRLVT